MRSADKSENKLGSWLPVKKEAGVYVETGIDGSISRFEVDNRPIELGIEHRILRCVNPMTGATDITIAGRTDVIFGAIGVTNEYPIFNVQLRAADGPAEATFTNVFWRMGHHGSSRLDITLPRVGLDYIVDTIENSRYPQQIIVRFKEGSFYQHPDPTVG